MDDGRKRRVSSKTSAGGTRRTCLAVAVVARRATCGIHKVQCGNTEARRGYRDCVGGRRSARHAFCRAWIAQLLLARRQPHCLLGRRAGEPRRITNWAGVSPLDLSVSADSKRLVFVNSGLQRELYVAENPKKGKLETPRRLTLEGRNNLPSAWTSDGQALFFYSDRNGNWDIFRQRLQLRTAEDFVVGPGEQTEPRLTPDGSSVLYWDYKEATAGASEPRRLMRVPISGGAPEQVLESSPDAEVRCARAHSRCILGERDRIKNELVFTDIDPVRGKAVELLRLAADPAASPEWDLSPDGVTVAIVNLDDAKDRMRLVQLDSKTARSISLGHAKTLSGISWSAHGKGWFVTSSSVRGASILSVQSNGASSELWSTSNIVGTPLSSPDDRNLAFTISTRNSNAWLIENF